MNEEDTFREQTARNLFLSQSSKTSLEIKNLIEKRRTTNTSKIKKFYSYIFNMRR
jgi:hypothetical protein